MKGAHWEKWIRRFERYLSATCKNYMDDQARDRFLNLVGNDVEDRIVKFLLESTTTYKGIIKCLTDGFNPQQNVDFEHYTFNTACQAHKLLDDFVNRPCKLVTCCEFDKFKNEAAIRLHIIGGFYSTGFYTKILKETYTLEKILTMARSEARDTSHAIQMENGRVRTIEQAHRMASSHSRHDKPLQTLKEKQETYVQLLQPGIPARLHLPSHGTQNARNTTGTTTLQASTWTDTSTQRR
ncbi:hypothetical protein NDU88_003707 [Pleurodeles waltl]|uniref:Uncharacterized protein n=1 Tax=Pleurodeles waltl TaxID=8319 RepID=A0AAV7KYU5_PLEWA|nr:hypothetical protein NDU88_003707 [Pleurodeles waltl]